MRGRFTTSSEVVTATREAKQEVKRATSSLGYSREGAAAGPVRKLRKPGKKADN
jgi:hypothetical protein